jgi:L-asparaginase
MNTRLKKILLIHTGGTFGMMPAEPTRVLAPADIQHLILKYLPEIENIARIDFEVAFNIDSANIQIHHWQTLAGIILKNYQKYDGFVIIHGTDSMVYSASALSFMLQGLAKPVIFTGSQRPLAVIRSDARGNLISSIELATYPIPEVSIYFDNQLFRGNRVIKISSTSYEAFASPNFPILAEVGLDLTISKNILPAGKKLFYHDGFDENILCIRFFPGLQPAHLETITDSPVKGVIIEALGLGNLSIHEKSLIPWIEKMDRVGKIIVISSQSPYGTVNFNLYECGQKIVTAGGISAADMTTAAAIIKLMFLLGQFPENSRKVKEYYQKSIAGELTESPART